METSQLLEQAIESKDRLTVVYLGGSQPGSVREIAPISIKNGKVRAKCYSSNAIKTFMVAKMQIMDSEGVLTKTNFEIPLQLPAFKNVAEFYEHSYKKLAKLNLHIEVTQDSISLHKLFKNGKPRKGSELSLADEEFTYDTEIDLAGNIIQSEPRKKVRPWTVRAKGKDTTTLGKLDKAAAKFLLLATSKN